MVDDRASELIVKFCIAHFSSSIFLFMRSISSLPPEVISFSSSSECIPIRTSGACFLIRNIAALYESICSGIDRYLGFCLLHPSRLAISMDAEAITSLPPFFHRGVGGYDKSVFFTLRSVVDPTLKWAFRVCKSDCEL